MVQDYPEEGKALSGARLLAVRIANALGKPLGINIFPRAFPNDATADLVDRRTVFDRIYKSNFWASAESRSGIGSQSAVAGAYRERLRCCLNEIGARRLFDAPCGDLNWMAPFACDPRLAYLGADISEALLADLRACHPRVALQLLDICEDEFPEADVWHCRDCLFHLPFGDIHRAFENFARSNIPYCLLTTHRARLLFNLDVAPGGFRYLDLERPPISLPKAMRYLKDFRAGDFPRYVGMWRRETVADAVARWVA